MSNKESKARAASAFRSMKAIGISEDKAKPVLKKLLKLYDNNWALIEEENYRVLADAIFDRDELEVSVAGLYYFQVLCPLLILLIHICLFFELFT